MLVITHRDAGEPSPSVIARLAKRKMTATIVPVAPFSDDDEKAKPGFGLERLIAATSGERLAARREYGVVDSP